MVGGGFSLPGLGSSPSFRTVERMMADRPAPGGQEPKIQPFPKILSKSMEFGAKQVIRISLRAD
eukprot:9975724-Alexandrium_andersonii.AAC.1